MPTHCVKGIHLTLLRSDGTGKADVTPNKLMIGASAGWPMVIAPVSDAGGLAITEGVEDALFRYTGRPDLVHGRREPRISYRSWLVPRRVTASKLR